MRRRISAAALAVAMSWGGVGLVAPAVAAPATAAPASTLASLQAISDLPVGTPKARTSLGDRLAPGASMDEQHYLLSSSGQHRLAADGWLRHEVGLYLASWSSTPEQLSTTGSRTDVENRLVMQTDGNLVLYTDGRATWNTRTGGNPGAYAVLQDDRNLVVYSAAGRPLFATHTVAHDAFSVSALGRTWESRLAANWYLQSPDRSSQLLMQSDGNLVLYNRGRALWSTRTNGNPGAHFVVQSDGNMVVYSAAGSALWNSGTNRAGQNAFGLMVQNDRNMVEYQISALGGFPRPVPIWATNTR